MRDKLSWWEYNHYLEEVEYTIVGGGIVGLSTAIEVKSQFPNSKVLVLDKKSLPIGASTKNAGFACFGSISEIMDDFELYGENVCRKLIQMRWEGLSILKTRIPAATMKYKSQPGAEIFSSAETEELYLNKIEWVNELVADIVSDHQCFTSKKGRFGTQIENTLEGSLNPQLMIHSLKLQARQSGVLFINGVDVEEFDFENKLIHTNVGELKYRNLLICTNGFTRKLLPEMDIKPARNQVFITNRIENFKLNSCYHMNKGYVYFREYENRLLIGGGRHLDFYGETTSDLGNTDQIINYLQDIVNSYILPKQEYRIEQQWSGILGVGSTKMPIVKNIHEHVTLAVRMGGMGVAIGSLIGKIAVSKMSASDNSAHRLYVS